MGKKRLLAKRGEHLHTLLIILEAGVLSSALSIDAFAASFAYGSNKIKIPFLSAQIINLICTGILGLSLLIGSLVKQLIPAWLTAVLCFALLFILGLVKLLDSLTKTIIRKYNAPHKELHFSLCNFRFVLSIYADPEKADRDQSKTISPAEAASLAIALSLDGLAVGFGAAMGNVNAWAVVLWSLLTNTAAILLGALLGNKIAQKLSFNLSWISGAILILLAISKLF